MKFRGRKHQPEAGFSLLELVIAVAVVVVLGALAISAMKGIRQNSGAVGCVTNMRSIYLAVISYSNDNGGRLPLYSDNQPGNLPWFYLLLPYLEIKSTAPYPRIFQCPVRPKEDSFHYKNMSYGWNACFPPSINMAREPAALPSITLSQIAHPSKLLLIAETDSSTNALSYICRDEGSGSQYKATYTHKGRANVLFMDGHVRAMTKAELNAPSESEAAFQLWYPFGRKI